MVGAGGPEVKRKRNDQTNQRGHINNVSRNNIMVGAGGRVVEGARLERVYR